MKVFSYWDTGETNAPPVVQHCFRRWRDLFGEDFEIISRQQAVALVSPHVDAPERLTPQVFADILRLSLLDQRGGLWVDATVLPRGDHDMIDQMFCSGDKLKAFIAPDATRPIANWALSARAGNRVVASWRDFYAEYWRKARRPAKAAPLTQKLMIKAISAVEPSLLVGPALRDHFRYFPYFACHYSLRYLLRRDPALADEIEKLPYDYTTISASLARGIFDQSPPVVKLSWRDPKVEAFLSTF